MENDASSKTDLWFRYPGTLVTRAGMTTPHSPVASLGTN